MSLPPTCTPTEAASWSGGDEGCRHRLTNTISASALVLARCQWNAAAAAGLRVAAIQNVHYLCIRDLCRVSLPLHQRAPTANQTDAAAVLRQNGNDQNAHMFNSDDIPALMLANLKTWALPTRSAMLIDMVGVTSLPCTS